MSALSDLIMDLDSRIKDEFEDLFDYPRQRSDKLMELAEEQVPDSRSKLADLLAADNSLADVDDPAMLPSEPTVWDIIGMSVRERLISEANDTYKGLEEEYEELKDTLEGLGYISGVTSRQPPDGKRKWYIYWERQEGENDETEVIVTPMFNSEMEAWKWLDLNEENLDPALKIKE